MTRAVTTLLVALCVIFTSGCTTKHPKKLQHAKFTLSPAEIPDRPKAKQHHKPNLLKAIRNLIDADQLTLPPGNNALYKIKEFENFYPDDSAALALRNEITDRYLSLALKQLQKPNPSVRDFDRSLELLKRAKQIDARLVKMDQLLTKLHGPAQKKMTDQKQRKVIRTPLNAEAVAARTSVVRDVAKVVAAQAIDKKGAIVVYGATQSDANWISGVIRSFFLGIDENRLPTIKTDSSKSWKPTIDIVYLD